MLVPFKDTAILHVIAFCHSIECHRVAGSLSRNWTTSTGAMLLVSSHSILMKGTHDGVSFVSGAQMGLLLTNDLHLSQSRGAVNLVSYTLCRERKGLVSLQRWSCH